MIKKTIEKNRGVSLLEILIYVAILASILVVVINTLISLNGSFVGIRLSKEVNTSAVTAFDRITNEVRKAKSIDQSASVFGVNPSVLMLSTTDDGGNPTTVIFSINNGQLHIARGGLDIGALTADNVTVTDFTVNFIDAGRSGVVTATLGLTGTRGKRIISETFRTAEVTRNQEI
mgnify:CR=1 FL=1